MPSMVFAEASWYGSIRGGVEFGGGNDAKFADGGSRWGIRGSSEVSEGLTAVYRFEHKLSTANASQPGGRLAYAGLSGGFGTITLGQVWSASFNSVGAITDKSYFYGNSETSYRVPSAASYALSAGNVSFQVDAIMNPGVDSGGAIDQLEFGLSLSLEGAKLAVAYVDKKDYMVTSTESEFKAGTPTSVTVSDGTASTPTTVTVTAGTPSTPTMVDVTAGTAGTPTDVDVTDGTAGTPTDVDVTDGTAGTPTDVDVTDGSANVPSTQPPVATPVSPRRALGADGGFNLAVTTTAGVSSTDVAPTTVWGAAGTADFTTGQLTSGSFMHSARLNSRGGNLLAASAVANADTLNVTPRVVTVISSVTVGENTTDLRANSYTVSADGMTYTASNCGDENITCTPQAAFAVEYRNPGDSPVLDQNTGNSVFPLKLSLFAGNAPNITHTASVDVPGPLQLGTAGTPTDVDVTDGSAGTPTMVDVTDGSAGTPTMVDVTDGSAGTPTDVDVTDGTAGTPTQVVVTDGSAGTPTTVTVTPGTAASMEDVTTTSTMRGSRSSHIAVEYSLGGITAHLGHSQKKTNGAAGKNKTTHFGISGGLGDTGMSFTAMMRSKKAANGSNSSPWLINVSRSLGGGASVHFEHANDDAGASGKTRIGLHVGF